MTSRSRVVLVVDDSIGVQTAVREALRPLSSVEVVCLGDVDGAEAWLERGRPDVALCDVVLPDRSGYDLCRRIKAQRAACPVLLLSSPFETFDESDASACGSDGVLGKPFTAAELRSRVEALLHPETGDGAEAGVPEAAAEVLAGPPDDELAELSEADVVAPEQRMTPDDSRATLARELLEPLAERLAEPLYRRLMTAWENGELPPAVERHISQAAERLVRQRLQELEDEATEVRYGPEEAD